MSGPDQHHSAATSSYHHGNLREALLQEAILCIRRAGVENLSLRALARNTGVSQTAPYRHFTDKNALLAELATQAFNELADSTAALIRPQQSAAANMQLAGEAYLRYALQNPEKIPPDVRQCHCAARPISGAGTGGQSRLQHFAATD